MFNNPGRNLNRQHEKRSCCIGTIPGRLPNPFFPIRNFKLKGIDFSVGSCPNKIGNAITRHLKLISSNAIKNRTLQIGSKKGSLKVYFGSFIPNFNGEISSRVFCSEKNNITCTHTIKLH